MLTLNIFGTLFSGVFIVDFEQVNIRWDLSASFEKLQSRKTLEKSHA